MSVELDVVSSDSDVFFSSLALVAERGCLNLVHLACQKGENGDWDNVYFLVHHLAAVEG